MAAKKIRGQKAWRREAPAGSKEREKTPASVYLDRERRRYPVKTWSEAEGKYKYSRQQLRNAISVANQQGDTAIQEKASRILAREFPKKDGYSYLSEMLDFPTPYLDRLLGTVKLDETNDADFTIRAKMGKRWIPHFMSMLKTMENYGAVGKSRQVGIYADGDGDFRPKFEASVEYKEVPPVKDEGGDVLYDAG